MKTANANSNNNRCILVKIILKMTKQIFPIINKKKNINIQKQNILFSFFYIASVSFPLH